MFIAIDEEGNRILADSAKKDKKYFCPICKTEVRLKHGNINATHFAHITLTNCDDFTHDMSEWHKAWQSLFPARNREVVIKGESEIHRADVLCYGTVIEFQHSPISEEEFWRRNEFYTGQGYKVVWIFDTIDIFEKNGYSSGIEYIDEYQYYGASGSKFRWKRPWRFLQGFLPQEEKDIDIFFHIVPFPNNPKDTDIGYIEKIVYTNPNGKTLWGYFRTSYAIGNYTELLEWLKDRWEKEKIRDSSLTVNIK